MLGIYLMVALVIVEQAQTQEKDVKARPWAVIARRHVKAAKVYAMADPAHPFAPLKEPVLHRTQEVQGSSKGSVFVWVEPSGRPAAICDVFVAEREGRYSLYNEWHSFSESPLRAESPNGVFLDAAGPGALNGSRFPNAPSPRRHAAGARPARPPACRTVQRRPGRPQERAVSLAAADDADISSRHDRLTSLRGGGAVRFLPANRPGSAAADRGPQVGHGVSLGVCRCWVLGRRISTCASTGVRLWRDVQPFLERRRGAPHSGGGRVRTSSIIATELEAAKLEE